MFLALSGPAPNFAEPQEFTPGRVSCQATHSTGTGWHMPKCVLSASPPPPPLLFKGSALSSGVCKQTCSAPLPSVSESDSDRLSGGGGAGKIVPVQERESGSRLDNRRGGKRHFSATPQPRVICEGKVPFGGLQHEQQASSCFPLCTHTASWHGEHNSGTAPAPKGTQEVFLPR